MFLRATPPILGPDRRPVPGSVARLVRTPIGGVDQWVLVRGVDDTQPILLVVPDGPGEGWIPVARRTGRELERAFLVATWDPRGSGLSYDRHAPLSALTVDRLVDDVLDLAGWLAREFGHPRVVLAGHGFGSAVGLLAASKAPDLFTAYIGVGQWVEPAESDRRARAWARSQAEALGRNGWVRAFTGDPADPSSTDATRTIDRALAELGGLSGRPDGQQDPGVAHLDDLSEYTVFDLVRARAGRGRSRTALAAEIRTLDLSRRVSRLDVPTYFVAGRLDRRVDPELAREFLRVLEAPRKGWAWIEGAAHRLPFDEPDAYAAALAHFALEARTAAGTRPHWAIAG